MPIVIKLDVLLATRKMKSRDLANAIGITEQNLSILKQGKVKGLRFSTLEAICRHLNCQPGELLEYRIQRHITPDAPDPTHISEDPQTSNAARPTPGIVS
jgi:putative transcriptional regulator